MPLFGFSTSDNFENVLVQSQTYRDSAMQDADKIFTTAQKEQDNFRIRKTLEFLFAAGPNFTGFIANKPEISKAEDALGYWVNHNFGEFGVELKNAVKSLIYQNEESGEVYAIVMPNDLELPKKFLKDLKLKRYDFAEDGAVIPRTINPATVLMMAENKIFCIHEKMNELDYCCNNLGSRFLSYSVSGAHHAAAIANIAERKVTFNGEAQSLKDQIEASKIKEVPSLTMSPQDQAAFNLFLMGDHGRSFRK
ncbi:MAG: hypothetical protein V4694_04500 [Pseudomonadota bacterium]